ncbi:ATP-dependent sacrificial sulfur transferase LarE [Ilumatobacteraceae bacterium]|nr:ATP-dependent sacrificial sulfur transferase LarE [Ilumatobacteraceae bacterium]
MTAHDQLIDADPPAVMVAEAISLLENWFRKEGSVTVAFSGGADSALLAWVANSVLGEGASIVTAVSPSLAGREAEDCQSLAVEWRLNWSTVETSEMEEAAYRKNDPDRCRHCKDALMDALLPLAAGTVVLGVNTDDLGDHRPGQAAASMAGARFPYVELGIDKQMVRAASQMIGLRTWDKPAAACLASRIPHGTEVSIRLLRRVERAEEVLHALHLGQVRVRDHGDIARIEVEPSAMGALLEMRSSIEDALQGLGYRYVTLDLGGFRSGSMNPVRPK